MKIWSSQHTFNHPWDTVTQAVWRKYPNPHRPEVVATDVVERSVKGGILHTIRLISSRWGFPDWAKRIVGAEKICYATEHSEVDTDRQMMTVRTKNLTLAGTVSMDERMEYIPDPNHKEKTVLKQETHITVHGVPLTSFIESYLINSITKNSFKGRDAMEWIIGKIDLEVEELLSSYKRGTTKLFHSFEELSDSTKKSIDDISSVAKKRIDEFQTLAHPEPSLPRI